MFHRENVGYCNSAVQRCQQYDIVRFVAALVLFFAASFAAAIADGGYQGPLGIDATRDGVFWWAQQSSPSVGFRSRDGCFYKLMLPRGLHGTSFAAAANDGGVWFTDYRDRAIVRVYRGRVSDFSIQTRPLRIAADSDGSAWFTDGTASFAHVSESGRVLHYAIPGGKSTGDITVRAGLVAITDPVRGEVVESRGGRIVRRIPLGAKSTPTNLRFMNDGTLAVLETGSHAVAFFMRGNRPRTVDVSLPSSRGMSAMSTDSSAVWVADGTSVVRVGEDGTSTHFALRFPAGGIASTQSATLDTEGYDSIAVIQNGTLNDFNIDDQFNRTMRLCRSNLTPARS